MFAEKLKILRIENNLSQVDLAKKVDLSKNSINAYEKGRAEASIETLIKFADIFNCSIDYLVGREDDFGVVQILNNEPSPLTSLEKELLNYFSKMSESQKHRLIGYAFAMVN